MARHKRKDEISRVFAQPVADMEKGERLRRIKWREDGGHLIEFGRIYLPHIFTDVTPECHYEWAWALTNKRRVARAAPRGHGKTQMMAIVPALYYANILGRKEFCPEERQRKYVLFIQSNQALAEETLDDIRRELEENELLRDDFGDLVGRGKWTQNSLNCSNGFRLRARGARGAMRGMVKRGVRPDLIIGDDIDGDDVADSVAECAKLKKWWRASVSNMPGVEGGQIFIIGTILSDGALLPEMLRNPKYDSRIYQAVQAWEPPGDATGRIARTLWPERWTAEKLEEKREEIGSLAFAQEYQNDPIDPEAQAFKDDVLEAAMYEDGEADQDWPAFGAADLAISLKKTADYFCTLVGLVGPDNRIWIDDGIHARWDFGRQIEGIEELDDRHRFRRFGVEEVAYQAALKQALQERSRRQGRHLPVVGVKQTSGKSGAGSRFYGLVPLFEQGTIRVNRRLKWLTEELRRWPKSEHDDAVDALEILVMRVIRGQKASRFSGVGMAGRIRN